MAVNGHQASGEARPTRLVVGRKICSAIADYFFVGAAVLIAFGFDPPFAARIKVQTAANRRKRVQNLSDRGVLRLVAVTSRPLASLARCVGLWGVFGILFSLIGAGGATRIGV